MNIAEKQAPRDLDSIKEKAIWFELRAKMARLHEENKRYRETLEWVRKMYEDEWTYEMGVGEVVCEIIQRFEEEQK